MSIEIKNKTFSKILRGYDPAEVEDYLDYIDGEYAKSERRTAENEKRLAVALKKLDEATRKLEKLQKANERRTADLHNIVAEAEQTAESIMADARARAAEMIKSAEAESARIKKQSEAELAEAKAVEAGIRATADDIYSEICMFRDSIFTLYESHIESIEELSVKAENFIDSVDGDAVRAESGNDSDDEAAESAVEEADAGVAGSSAILDFISDFDADEFGSSGAIDFDADINGLDEFEDADDEHIFIEIPDDTGDDEIKPSVETDFDSFFDTVEGFKTIDGLSADEDVLSEDAAAEGFVELDDFFTEDVELSGMSLTDEFDMIFSNNNSKKNIDEIRRQPTIGAEEVPKHSWFDIKKQK